LWLALRNRALPSWTAPTALAAAIAFRALPSEVATFGIATVLLALAVVTIDRAPAMVLRALSQPALCQFGLWSYSIYLWQQPFYKLHRDGVASPALLLVGATACALASFSLVEKPGRTVINQRFSPQRAALA
jgi:peptidoglycan/LPS O-acetylase OafA/YrhL